MFAMKCAMSAAACSLLSHLENYSVMVLRLEGRMISLSDLRESVERFLVAIDSPKAIA
jgi:collagenase-like PrtC family protease